LVFKVILDTNMLMFVAEKRIDIFGRIESALQGKVELVVPNAVLVELSRLSRQRSKRARYARMALELAEKCGTWKEQMSPKESTDNYLARVAQETGGIIATGDMELVRKARNANIPVVYLKKDLHLAVEGLDPGYR